MRDGLGNGIEVLCEIAGDDFAKPSDRIRAIDIMAKYGLGAGRAWNREAVIELTQKLGEAVASRVQDEEKLAGIRDEWIEILRRTAP